VKFARSRADRRGGWNDGGTLALDHLFLRSNSARGGLFKKTPVTLTDVIVRGNTAHVAPACSAPAMLPSPGAAT
jgi:hypothetical protein